VVCPHPLQRFVVSIFCGCEPGKYKEGIKALKQVIELKPNWARAHYHLGVAYLKIGKEDSALEQYKTLKGLDQNYANKLFNEIYKNLPIIPS